MRDEIEEYVIYLVNVKKSTKNTVESYRRDLSFMADFFQSSKIFDIDKITYTSINSYILYLEKNGKSASTIKRNISSMKTFFHFMLRRGYISDDPTELIEPPRIEKKAAGINSLNSIEKLSKQPKGDTPMALRDRAMIELLCDTGMRVSEITDVCVTDVNLPMSYVICRNNKNEKIIPLKRASKNAVEKYLERGRSELAKDGGSRYLFINCRGGRLSRQGFWKIVKDYAKKAGITEEISPQKVRNSAKAAN